MATVTGRRGDGRGDGGRGGIAAASNPLVDDRPCLRYGYAAASTTPKQGGRVVVVSRQPRPGPLRRGIG